jgi:hypothetical protein
VNGESILDKHLREQRERTPGASAPGDASGNTSGNAAGDGHDAGLSVSEAFVSMLDFAFADGRRVALPYATLLKAECHGAASVTLTYSTDTVVITGRRLDTLYKAIVQHRAREVKVESGNAKALALKNGGGTPGGGDEVVVAAVTITPQE